MSISTKLQELNQIKLDIKQALIDSGKDMTNVPFTEYASKIGGGVDLTKMEFIRSIKSGSTNSVEISSGYKLIAIVVTGNYYDGSGEASLVTKLNDSITIDNINGTYTIENLSGGSYGTRLKTLTWINNKTQINTNITSINVSKGWGDGKTSITALVAK